jgi:outer membrane protein assembly factor BamB
MIVHQLAGAGALLGLLLAQPESVDTQATDQATDQATEAQATDALGVFAWPQWNGPQLDGVSTESAWASEGKPDPLWEAELGLGYSTVSIAGGKLYTMGYDVELGLDVVFCFDALTGEEVWAHAYPSEIWNRAHEGGTVNTPSVDGGVVFSLNREGNLYALDAGTGEVNWHTELKGEEDLYELLIPTWGFSGSPLILSDGLFLNCGRLLSVDKKSGEILWTSEDFGDGYGTPLSFTHRGKAALAVVNSRGLGIVNRESGETLGFMEFGGTGRGVSASTPVLLGEDLLVSASSIPASARINVSEDELAPVWTNTEMVTSFSGSIVMGGYIYGYDGSILKCVNQEGKPMWNERGIGNGAVAGAGDRLLVMGGNGEFMVLKATPESFDVLSVVPLFEEGRFWSKPVIANGIIYCRSSKGKLVALDHRL